MPLNTVVGCVRIDSGNYIMLATNRYKSLKDQMVNRCFTQDAGIRGY
jgi:hypothetical protein